MNSKSILRLLTGITLAGAVSMAQAVVLSAGDILTIGAGSWFAMDQNANGSIEGSEMVSISPGSDGGVVIGSLQTAGAIDTWVLFDIEGGHYTTVSPTGSAEVGLDFSGWSIFWDGQGLPDGTVNEGIWEPSNCAALGCADVDFIANVASLEWSGTYGDGYSLWYSWRFNTQPGCFGCTVNYLLHLEGVVVSAVPVPPAVWLLGSGLLGLFGVTHRRINQRFLK